ncbi:Di-sulfide bridge nucleocytoplasmic transport domain-containing protein [Epithele typhae]|uniref:Di-sulfide bridge nucleocytoplasmic transport domain-containing protein n=1 Tax=Epithele typhae TaxID=378194 RepID=UPI00200756A7|nr:Di-sulfide bridge nucleocytoplasmic transport domain-containing protein [Epithele typhae]KAH9938981.1 Di-sulfide bridge nucleocytoplasmic transport domain-containing protein [Epithele typhae]
MDFEFTSRPSSNTKPVWASSSQEDPRTPKKRSLAELNTPSPGFPQPQPHSPSWPRFGRGNNVPFLFQEPAPHSSHSPAWAPPQSPVKFPEPELNDVDMADTSLGGQSPEKGKEHDGDGERVLAAGALQRVYKKRNSRERSRLRRHRSRVEDEESSEGESDGDDVGLVTRKTTNHYTLNMTGPSAPQSDSHVRLLGYVQVFFNGSLAAIVVYLTVQFILTIQRDVEHRVAEYSMNIVQDIAHCASSYKENLCAESRIPAMAHQCSAWEVCMNRDPSKVGRAKVSLEVMGELVNSFVEEISWKTMIFTISSLTLVTLIVNGAASYFRSHHNPAPFVAPPHIPPYPLPPAYAASHGYLPAPQDWHEKPWKHPEDDASVYARRRRLEGGQAAKVK